MPKRNKKLSAKFKGQPCENCGRPGEGCHVITFGSDPALDVAQNMISLCRNCHQMQGARGFFYLSSYARIERILLERGFYVNHKGGFSAPFELREKWIKDRND